MFKSYFMRVFKFTRDTCTVDERKRFEGYLNKATFETVKIFTYTCFSNVHAVGYV